MEHRRRTIDLATVAAPSNYIGQRAVWTDFEGREHVGVLAPDPFGGPFPVVDFGDGTYGRNGSVVTLVIESDPLDVDHLRYLGKLHAQGVEYKPYSSQAGLSTLRGTR